MRIVVSCWLLVSIGWVEWITSGGRSPPAPLSLARSLSQRKWGLKTNHRPLAGLTSGSTQPTKKFPNFG